MRMVFLGLSISSSWGNGHATNYRALLEALREAGHDVLFLERDRPWYAASRDWQARYARLYESVEELEDAYAEDVRGADLVLVGSFVPDGVRVGEWVCRTAGGVTAFWDLDTPVTVEKLALGDEEYLSPALAARYDLYLSFTGGPLLARVGARDPRPFWCLVDPARYHPVELEPRWDLGYLGTYSAERQPAVDTLLLQPARALPQLEFALAGPQYPDGIDWPANVERIEHLAPADHAGFYGRQRFTLNVTRPQMVQAGWSPSVRLFEAAACGTPVISDWWIGLDEFFDPGREILIGCGPSDVLLYLTEIPEDERRALGERARERVLAQHTAAHRAEELERHVRSAVGRKGLARA